MIWPTRFRKEISRVRNERAPGGGFAWHGPVRSVVGESHDRDRLPIDAWDSGAPDFALPSTLNGPVGPRNFLGRPLILAFYPADWSPVCTDQLALYQEVLPEFEKHRAQLLGISVDSIWSHLAFAGARSLHFPLLADFEPKGEVSRAYGVYRAQKGTSERALFVLDPAGVVSWSYVSPTEVNPGADGILRALEDLAKKVAS